MSDPIHVQLTRRAWLAGVGLAGLVGCGRNQPTVESLPADAPLRFPGKVPMRALNHRPPCLETPWRYFQTDLTPNEAFYVRWHLQVLPNPIDVPSWRLRVDGHVERPAAFSLDELRRMPAEEVIAVNQCSGNSRGLFQPALPGAQWHNGAMGNARWRGVPLRHLLERVGLKAGSVEVAFEGMDRGGLPSVPNFVKSLPVDRARDREILVAYSMNDAPLPLLHGFPVRLVVPGWYATYWVKSLESITVLTGPCDNFWMKTAYRIPTTANAVEKPDQLAKVTVPIHRMNVRSFFTLPETLSPQVGKPVELNGIAFDGGSGIARVEVSTDGGTTWQAGELGPDLGRFSFRRWYWTWTPQAVGEQRLLVRATSTTGETQPLTEGWNRAGYMRNVIEAVRLEVRA